MVCLMTLCPAKPINAPGSAIIRSPSHANDALTPPIVGSVRIEIYGSLASSRSFRAAEVFDICIKENVLSCILAPPDALTMIKAWRFSIARFIALTIFSPSTEASEPPMKPKSKTTSWISCPLHLPSPHITELVRPVFSLFSVILFLYDFLSTKFKGSTGFKFASNSTKLPSSQIKFMRSSAFNLMW